MTMASNNRNNQFNLTSGNGRSSFQEHNQRMKAFRLAHPNNWRQWGRKTVVVTERLPALVLPIILQRARLSTYSPN